MFIAYVLLSLLKRLLEKGEEHPPRRFIVDICVVLLLLLQDARRLRVSFGGNNESERAMNMLQQLAFPGQNVSHEIGVCVRISRRRLDCSSVDSKYVGPLLEVYCGCVTKAWTCGIEQGSFSKDRARLPPRSSI